MPVGKAPSRNLRVLPWDSSFWQFRVAGWSPLRLTPARLRRAIQWCRRKRIRCLYACVDGEDLRTRSLLAKEGFVFADVRMEMSKTILPGRSRRGIRLREPTEKELPALCRMASRSHGNTRFGQDGNFDPAQVRRFYALWLAKAAARHAVLVLPGGKGSPAGYVTWEKESGRRGRIGLIAVASDSRGRGWGRKLLEGAVAGFQRLGVREVRAATQGTSGRAVRMYEKAGFTVADVKVWYHRWFFR